jgi:hypothetical protein
VCILYFIIYILKLKFVHLFKKFCNISFVILPPEDGLEYGSYRLSRNFGKELPLYAAQIPEEHRSLLLRSGSLKSTGEVVCWLALRSEWRATWQSAMPLTFRAFISRHSVGIA